MRRLLAALLVVMLVSAGLPAHAQVMDPPLQSWVAPYGASSYIAKSASAGKVLYTGADWGAALQAAITDAVAIKADVRMKPGTYTGATTTPSIPPNMTRWLTIDATGATIVNSAAAWETLTCDNHPGDTCGYLRLVGFTVDANHIKKNGHVLFGEKSWPGVHLSWGPLSFEKTNLYNIPTWRAGEDADGDGTVEDGVNWASGGDHYYRGGVSMTMAADDTTPMTGLDVSVKDYEQLGGCGGIYLTGQAITGYAGPDFNAFIDRFSADGVNVDLSEGGTVPIQPVGQGCTAGIFLGSQAHGNVANLRNIRSRAGVDNCIEIDNMAHATVTNLECIDPYFGGITTVNFSRLNNFDVSKQSFLCENCSCEYTAQHADLTVPACTGASTGSNAGPTTGSFGDITYKNFKYVLKGQAANTYANAAIDVQGTRGPYGLKSFTLDGGSILMDIDWNRTISNVIYNIVRIEPIGTDWDGDGTMEPTKVNVRNLREDVTVRRSGGSPVQPIIFRGWYGGGDSRLDVSGFDVNYKLAGTMNGDSAIAMQLGEPRSGVAATVDGVIADSHIALKGQFAAPYFVHLNTGSPVSIIPSRLTITRNDTTGTNTTTGSLYDLFADASQIGKIQPFANKFRAADQENGFPFLQLIGPFTGDVTNAANVATIAANAVTNAKLADVPTATFKGRATAGTGDPQDLTIAQSKALLGIPPVGTGSHVPMFTPATGTDLVDTTMLMDSFGNPSMLKIGGGARFDIADMLEVNGPMSVARTVDFTDANPGDTDGTVHDNFAQAPQVAAGYSLGALRMQGAIDNNLSAALWHGAYVTNDGTTFHVNRYARDHASFGARGIQFGFGTAAASGIQFFANSAATVAGARFTPKLRASIDNSGVFKLWADGATETGGNYIGFTVPSLAGSLNYTLANARPTASGQFYTCTAADPSVCSWAAPPLGVTGTGSSQIIPAWNLAGTGLDNTSMRMDSVSTNMLRINASAHARWDLRHTLETGGVVATPPPSSQVDSSPGDADGTVHDNLANAPGFQAGYSLGSLMTQGYVDNGQLSSIWQNAYLTFQGTSGHIHRYFSDHASFGARGMEFGFGSGANAGIRFFTSSDATVADARFTPLLRVSIDNAGVFKLWEPTASEAGGDYIGYTVPNLAAPINYTEPNARPTASGQFKTCTAADPSICSWAVPAGTSGITALTGDVSATGPGSAAATLASTITAGGPVGSSTVVPVITWDAKGRLTAVTTATVGGGGSSTVSVNGTGNATPNLNDTTPAAPTSTSVGGVNALWQTSGSSVSAYVKEASLLLRNPTDGSWSDGINSTWTSASTKLLDAMDDLNETLGYLAPADAASLAGGTLTLAGASLVTGFASAGNTNYKTGLPAGSSYATITNDNTYTLTTPSTSTVFNKADEGTLKLYRGVGTGAASAVATVDLAANFVEASRAGTQATTPWTNGDLSVTSVGWYNSFPKWQKGNATATYSGADTAQGYNASYIAHEGIASTQTSATTDIFYDNDAGANPSVSTPTVAEGVTVNTRFLSGVKYYDRASQFKVGAVCSDCFDNVYVTNPVSLSASAGSWFSTTAVPWNDATVSGLSATPAIGETMTVTDKVVTVSSSNVISIDARVVATPSDPYGSYSAGTSASANRLVDGYTTTSTALSELFDDEDRRQPSGTFATCPGTLTGQWTSSTALTTGQAQLYNGSLVYPAINYGSGYLPSSGQPNYSAFSGNQVYYRTMFQTATPHSSGTLALGGLVSADVGAVGSGAVNVEIKLCGGETGWLDLGCPFNSGTFTGVDGDCIQTAQAGSNWSWSAGTKSTANSSFMYVVRVTLRNATRPLSSMTESAW